MSRFLFILLVLFTISGYQVTGEYEVNIYTSWDWNSGTDSDIYVTLLGVDGVVMETTIGGKADDAFDRGTVYTYAVGEDATVGVVHTVQIGLNNAGQFYRWKLNKIDINDTTRGEVYSFDCRCWIEGFDRPHRNLTRPVDGGWGAYGNWSQCTKTCEGGQQARARECNDPAPMHGGAPCTGDPVEKRVCNPQSCKVHGGWGQFGDWGNCSKICGGGHEMRNRSCDNPPPMNGGDPCKGNSTEFRTCNTQECPIDGGWGNWTAWSSCSVTCDLGNQTRMRKCDNPPPQFGGQNCAGDSTDMQECKMDVRCPIDGGWSNWSAYTACTRTCEGGTHQRTRECSNPAPAYGGRTCAGNTTQLGECGMIPCPDRCTLPDIKKKGFYGDTANCRTYFACVYGRSLPKCCPPGLGWDDVTTSCSVRTCKASCLNPTVRPSHFTTPVVTTTLPPDACVTADQKVKRVVRNQPTKYSVRMGHVYVTLSCPNGKFASDVFSLEKCACVTDETATSAPDSCSPGNGLTYKVDSADAQKYYMLWLGQQILQRCAAGYKFSLDLCRCSL